LRAALVVADGAALLLAVGVAHCVRFDSSWRAKKLELLADHPGFVMTAFLLLWAVAAAAELYEPIGLRRQRELAVRVAAAAGAWAAGVIVAMYLVPPWEFGRGIMVFTAAGWALLAWLGRLAARTWLLRRPRPRALVAGAGEAVAALCAVLARHPLSPWQPVAVTGASARELGEAVTREGAEAVVVVSRGGETLGDVAALHFSGVPVVAASEVWAWLEGRLPLDELTPSSFLYQPGFGAVHWTLFNRATRVLDVIVATVLLLVTLPIVALAALAVLICDGRPVLYRQRRVGRLGREFTMVKLRTMRRDAEKDGPQFAARDDPRVTPLGRVLRRLRLDELTQLVNVLLGEMSLVGPRPERPEFVAQLAAQIPYYPFRLAVAPGLTGWAQVNMPSAVTLEEHRRKLEYDLFFIRERSLGLYLLILLRTVSAALGGRRR
jgi:exopolysaccharide biosynthesis polyprenyl glycosylphosphotransferase